VDDQNRPVPPGTPGKKVLITNLANRLQPFIRCEVGDVVTLADTPCRCGSRLPRVAHIDGRTADTFYIRDGHRYRQVINSVFKNAFDYTREVREWQAVQVERNRVQVRLELLPGASWDENHSRRSVDRQLALYGYQGLLDVHLEVVPKLSADPRTGKFRRMVTLVGPPEESAPTLVRLHRPEPTPGASHLPQGARTRHRPAAGESPEA
jgi:phenylacetate-coenzyme A ligase PaaK-like adenylate-forming protein